MNDPLVGSLGTSPLLSRGGRNWRQKQCAKCRGSPVFAETIIFGELTRVLFIIVVALDQSKLSGILGAALAEWSRQQARSQKLSGRLLVDAVLRSRDLRSASVHAWVDSL